jgi:hypothetical protein
VSGKGKGKGKAKGASRQQQQQDAARRRAVTAPGGGHAAQQPSGQDGRRVRDVVLPEDAAALPAAAAQVKQYADVAAVRVQDWLGRTPDLKFRRGASILLSDATAPDSWAGRLPPGVRWNDEAGEVDGVVALVADGEFENAALEDAARAVARRMRELMPQCPIQAVAGSAASYAEAYPGMARARREGQYLLDWPPTPPEVFLAKPCDQCRQAAATRHGIQVTREDSSDLCAECHARWKAAGRSAATERLAPEPERRMRAALEAAGMKVRGFSDSFADMARAGRRDSDDAATQIALIYADGNKVGAFLARAAGLAGGPAKSEIAPVLDGATLGALAAAVRNRFGGWSRPPVLAHLAGGDDLLVSVPAADAWLFAYTLLDEFTSQLAAATAGWPVEVRENPPTLSAGLVFHHAKDPFSDVVRLAGERLRAAKSATSGSGASVAFLDLTADGSQPPPGRDPLTLGYLHKNAGRFQDTAALPGSRRATLLDLARQPSPDEFIARLTDFASIPLWEFAAGEGAPAQDVRVALHKSSAKRDEVRRALDVARHWHADPRKEEDQ